MSPQKNKNKQSPPSKNRRWSHPFIQLPNFEVQTCQRFSCISARKWIIPQISWFEWKRFTTDKHEENGQHQKWWFDTRRGLCRHKPDINKIYAHNIPAFSHTVSHAYCWFDTSTLPKITHPVRRGDESGQKQPSITRKHIRHKGRKIRHCHNWVSIWDADVKDLSKTVGFGVRRVLHHCSYAQGMRWKFQEGALLGLRSPRACLSQCGFHQYGANIKQLFIQHLTRYTPQSQAIYSCPHQLRRFTLKTEMQMLMFHRPVSCTCALQINNTFIQH